MTSQRGTVIFVGLMIAFFGTFIWFVVTETEPRRDARLERQLEMIRTAQGIDDLRPLLEEIVRRQRNDYK
jgi:hypothetical protein